MNAQIFPIKLEKYIANSSFCSRRDAKYFIQKNMVTVNKLIQNEPSFLLHGNEIVEVNGQKIFPIKEREVFLYHKKSGYITTHKDPQNRLTIFDDLPEWCQDLKTVGRLDKNTEGLLLLTNDSAYAGYLEHPDNSIKRTYQVKTFGTLDVDSLKSLKNGIEIDGIRYKEIDIKILEENRNNSWLEITLIEGKNREIRKILNYFELKIKRLIRVKYGEYVLGDLQKGELELYK